jgi:prolyl 4-hydroxylase
MNAYITSLTSPQQQRPRKPSLHHSHHFFPTMTASALISTLLLLTIHASSGTAFKPTCFAGGFGASKSKPKKVKPKKKSSIVDELNSPTPPQQQEAPKLDRFGLPVITEEDIFPPLSPHLVRIPVKNDKFVQSEVADATKKHLGVNLNIFDEQGYSLHSEAGTKWKLNLLHADPPVFTIDNFFSIEECIEYMSMVDPASDKYNESNTISITSPTFANSISRRTSTTYFCRYSSVPTLLAKAKHLLNVDIQQFEEPQIVRYRTGQEFSWHYDEIPKVQLENGGQRLATLLIYLNNVEKGGATIFRDLTSNNQPLKVQPKRGMALLFFPSYKDGTPDSRTLHKGEVALDTKMIAQMWIHEREYVASAPRDNLQMDALEEVEAEEERLGFS